MFLIVFVSLVLLVSYHVPAFPEWVVYAALPFAVFRAGRTIAFNPPGEFIRGRFTVTVDDGSGAGKTVEPAGEEGTLRYKMGQLLSCPICSGQWAGLLLVSALVLPAFGQLLIVLLGASGIAELVHWVAQNHEWAGRYAREQAGKREQERAWVWRAEYDER